jgi:sugar-specific transcriptional regulator TrmB
MPKKSALKKTTSDEEEDLMNLSIKDIPIDKDNEELQDEVDDEDTAESELKDDEAELEAKVIFQVALKSTQLADLYFEAIEDFSKSFYFYKNQAAEYYNKLAKDKEFQNAGLMAVLMSLQANDFSQAQKILGSVNKMSQNKKDKNHPDNIIIQICQDLIADKSEEVQNRIKKGLINVDKDIQQEVSRTLKYITLQKTKGN